MSFKSDNFCHIASNNRNNVKVGVFIYRTTDNLATVSASGYFNGRITDINLHDLIIHEQIDASDNTKVERNVLCVVGRTLDNVSTAVIPSKWEKDIEDTIDGLDDVFLKLDGSNIMTAPLRMIAGSMRGAIAPYWDGLGFFKVNTDESQSVSLIASIDDPDGFVPATTNTLKMGSANKKWKDLYLGGKLYVPIINNGGDLEVPTGSGTLATKADVDTAANSGDQLYTTGVWYAKMYAGTTPPASAEVEGRNYADFSQVDGEGNPIIVVYTYTSGAWATTETITPPADYNGYMTITSKIWDISEQSGQQGGLILWSHNQKTFTPYPRIVSFEDAHLTGTPTTSNVYDWSVLDMVATKKYVDLKSAPSINAEYVGSVNISSPSWMSVGYINNFSASNYILVPSVIDLTSSSIFIVLSFKTGSTLSSVSQTIFGDIDDVAGAFKLEKNSDNKLVLNGVESSLTLQPDTEYLIAMSNTELFKSTDGGYGFDVIAHVPTITGSKGRYFFNLNLDTGGSTQLFVNKTYINIQGDRIWQLADVPGLQQRVVKGHEVIDFQAPTAQNNYTWYRKYADGWVEQGGIGTLVNNYYTANLPVEMADTNYVYSLSAGVVGVNNSVAGRKCTAKTTTSITILGTYAAGGATFYDAGDVVWEIKGMAA